jgi:Siphovirus Gp157
MDQVEDAAAEPGEIPAELLQEINDYFEAFRTKVDRIAGYWRWQESIADICGKEAERLEARKKAAEGRLGRLKNMLLAFMMARGLKKLEGENAAIGMQANGMASLVIDDRRKSGSASSRATSDSRRRSFRKSPISWLTANCGDAWRPRSRARAGRSTAPPYDSR